MQDQRIRSADVNPANEDRDTEGAVVAHLLYLHPAQLTVEEIVERAIRDLTRAGLLHCNRCLET